MRSWSLNPTIETPNPKSQDRRNSMKTRSKRWWIAIFLLTASLLGVRAQSAQKDLQKLTVGYTPIAGASLPFFIAVEERIFQKYGFEIFPVFMGGSPLINSAILAGEFSIGYTFGLNAKNAGYNLLFRPSQTEYGLFPTAVIAARESWLKDAKNHKTAVDFLRAHNEQQQLARENAAATKRALRRFTRVDDDASLQGSFEYYKDAFPSSLRVIEKAMANALKFVDHPKAKQADVRQSFDNSFVDEAMRQ